MKVSIANRISQKLASKLDILCLLVGVSILKRIFSVRRMGLYEVKAV